jgi:hypothetical protein
MNKATYNLVIIIVKAIRGSVKAMVKASELIELSSVLYTAHTVDASRATLKEEFQQHLEEDGLDLSISGG